MMAAPGLWVCRAGFAGRGTACARSADATRSRPGPTRDKGLESSICPAGGHLLNASGSPTASTATHFVSLTVAVFYLLAAITVGSALGVALSHSIVYSAFALMGTLLGVAAMFVLLGADFLGVVQLLVYVGHFLVLGGILFALGLFTVITRRNAIGILMGVELVLNSANINYVAFARYANAGYDGQVFAIFVIMLAAAEAAIGLAIVLGIYQSFETIDVEATDRLRQ